ncbi:hypothetical protein ASD65_17395 [Microbacterium sp. Root61]|uniref:LpqB family beta-propeller domain-containing protein n=1 Tax=Microbacterium sp. Root61 TaxID=1736570 RepID=UPI0006FAA5EF|nr:LpqB family beta-propeller domain-containing protein [Microbacterium sp. Root61]KRA22270.1 hypothetical protein ASD65_17395 [Microbacterium sp. Root61]
MSVRRSLVAVVMAAAVLVLAACTGLPTSGQVYAGRDAAEQVESPDFSFIPDRPQPGATPEQIVDGFIRAGSGPAGEWARANLFLAPGAEWDPWATVTVDVQGSREVVEVEPATASPDDTHSTVTAEITPVANVDNRGVYSPSESVVASTLPFQLEKQPDGEWRITEAPDGVVLDQNLFTTVYRHYSLMFFDPTWQFLVPDVRWFPRVKVASTIATQLAAGPAEWLTGAVGSGFTDGTLVTSSVVTSNVADVALSVDAQTLDTETIDRMQTQLTASLAAAGVSEVRMSADGVPLTASIVPVRSTTVAAAPLVLTETDFGFLGGDALVPIPGLSDAMMSVTPAPVSAQMSPDRDFAAVRLEGGGVSRVEARGDVVPLDTRAGLIDPTVDAFGYTWSVPRDSPSGLSAYDPTGVHIDFPTAWSNATQISAMALSRDGTRLVALLTGGGRTSVWVAAVVRNADGVPQSVGVPIVLSESLAAAGGVAWLDGATVGVLGSSGSEPIVLEQPIGGPSIETDAPASSATIAGSNQATTVRLRGSDDTLYVKRGTNWQPLATGIRLLATQQGTPQQ